MKKTDRIAEFVTQLGQASAPELDPRYTGFFLCFNQQRYYEAHDVWEDLWLRDLASRPAGNYRFFKGLIQIAGAFVHLQKQHLRPDHPKDGRRTRPAARLFQLAADNLSGFRPYHMSLDVEALWNFCLQWKSAIEKSDFAQNPWNPPQAPRLELDPRH